jgi:isopenicillin N synthase-like dioxygenase
MIMLLLLARSRIFCSLKEIIQLRSAGIQAFPCRSIELCFSISICLDLTLWKTASAPPTYINDHFALVREKNMPHGTPSAEQEQEFPIIDFGTVDKDPHRIAAEIFDAAHRWGFLVLKNHGIPQQDVEDMFATSEDFFKQPMNVKEEKWMNVKQQGYDYKESVIGVAEGMCFGSVADANLTCDNLPSWWNMERRKQAEEFRSKCNELAMKLLKTIAFGMGLAPDYFFEAHNTGKEPGNVLRLIRYPALSKPLDPSFPRLGEHTDW